MTASNGAPTIHDVAALAGVSRAAVSKVIRQAYGVSPSMRERVEAAIRQLDYRPSSAARALRGNGWTIGVELVNLGNPFFDKLIVGMTQTVGSSPYQLIVAPAFSDSGEGRRAIDVLVDRNVDGLIAVAPHVARDELERVGRRIPLVLLGRHDPSDAYDVVVGDDEAGTRLVVEHLVGLGHRSIVHLTRPHAVAGTNDGNPHRRRVAAFTADMAARSLAELTRVLHPASDDQVGIDDALLPVLLGPDRPTAIFAADDILALKVLVTLDRLGLSTGDISVAGYDDIDVAAHPRISLTTVDQFGVEMGATAASLLLERIAGRTEAAERTITPVLRQRGSTGRA